MLNIAFKIPEDAWPVNKIWAAFDIITLMCNNRHRSFITSVLNDKAKGRLSQVEL